MFLEDTLFRLDSAPLGEVGVEQLPEHRKLSYSIILYHDEWHETTPNDTPTATAVL